MARRAGLGLTRRACLGAPWTLVLTIPACAADRPPAQRPADEVKQSHEADLMRIPGVVGVGIGQCDGQACIKVLVEQATPEVVGAVPTTLEGVRVEVEEIGRVSAQ